MRIRWTDPAETDLFDICEYIARDNPAAASGSDVDRCPLSMLWRHSRVSGALEGSRVRGSW